MRPSIPPLHVITSDAVVARDDFLAQARRIIEAGGPFLSFHLRAPHASGRRLYEMARALRDPVYAADGWLLVNDRVDVALAAGADGVHLGARGLRAADARRLLGPDHLMGVSVHSAEEARAAHADGADFVLAGTIWETPSHPGRPGGGAALLREIAGSIQRPAVAIGGVTPERVAEARAAGAWGMAVIRGVWDAPDPAAAVDAYLKHWKG
ncbi:MAG TPA: thiamine phosphate synthase [Longimicrobium sp.]|nr:thiamine phosphate synthase [Longimicrobium sp.]